MRNWTVKEAVETINAGADIEGIQEIGKHFPIFAMAAAKNDLSAVAQLMTDKFTLNRLSKAPLASTEAEEEDEVEDVKPAKGKTKPAAKATEVEEEDEDLEAMSTKQLMTLCDKRGIKVPKYGKNKAFYLEALAGASADAEDEVEEEDQKEIDYTVMSAKELFGLCKERGIKTQPQKKAAEYIKLLKAADAKATEAEDEEEGWEDEEEDEAPAKPSKAKADTKAPAKPAAKAGKGKAKKEEVEEESDDDGDNWDI